MMRVDSAILAVVVAFLLPLRLLSLVVRLNSSGSAGDLRRSCTAFAIAAALLSAIFALPRDHVGRTGHCDVPVADAGDDGKGREVRLEIEQLKLQLNRLESFWENNSKASDDKGHGSEEDVEVVKAMGLDIQALIKEQENIKAILVKMHTELDNNSKASDVKGHVSEEDGEVVKAIGLDIQAMIKEQENIKELLWISYSAVKSVTNEVRILSADSRKMNSDIDNVWSLANDTNKAVEALHSDVKKVQVITDESRKMSSRIHQVWYLAKDNGKKVEALYADIEKVQIVSDISRKMEANMHKMWSYAKQTEKRVEDLYSDVKKALFGTRESRIVKEHYSHREIEFKKKGAKLPFWPN